MDHETYATKHIGVGCRCPELPKTDIPELTLVSKALNEGGLPLLWLEDSGADGDAVLRVTSCQLVSRELTFYLPFAVVDTNGYVDRP
jgi:hypothetical protein